VSFTALGSARGREDSHSEIFANGSLFSANVYLSYQFHKSPNHLRDLHVQRLGADFGPISPRFMRPTSRDSFPFVSALPTAMSPSARCVCRTIHSKCFVYDSWTKEIVRRGFCSGRQLGANLIRVDLMLILID